MGWEVVYKALIVYKVSMSPGCFPAQVGRLCPTSVFSPSYIDFIKFIGHRSRGILKKTLNSFLSRNVSEDPM